MDTAEGSEEQPQRFLVESLRETMLVNSFLSLHLIVDQEALRTMCAGVASQDQEQHCTQKGARQERGKHIIHKYRRRLMHLNRGFTVVLLIENDGPCSHAKKKAVATSYTH